MKKALLLYESFDKYLKKVAMAISRGLEAGNIIVDSVSIKKVNVEEVYGYDVIGVGGSTNTNGVSKKMKIFLEKMRKLNMEKKYGFAFDIKKKGLNWLDPHQKELKNT